MPEGPSLVILKEELQTFKGKKVLEAVGNTKIDIKPLKNKKLVDIKTWGKHFLLCFPTFTIRIHFLMFGRYVINEERDKPVRLGLKFKNGYVNFYNCSVKFIEDDLDEVYDWTGDVLNDNWDPKAAKKKLTSNPDMFVTDALLDQNIFAGVGNIIKNEVLYRISVHPENTVGDLPPLKLKALIDEARNYSFDFLKWKKQYVLKKHWLAHTKQTCHRDAAPILKRYMGKTQRRTFYCEICQVRYFDF